MGEVAGINAGWRAKETPPPQVPEREVRAERARLTSLLSETGRDAKELCRSLQWLMWEKGGIIRSFDGLTEALARIEELRTLSEKCRAENPVQLMRRLDLHNRLLISKMVCKAALCREESRGAHYRRDFSEERNPEWRKNIVIRNRGGHGFFDLDLSPVPQVIIRPGLSPHRHGGEGNHSVPANMRESFSLLMRR
jgi:fumarate reductase (CoM/CoB) subunit A